jgi:hypothetical protein
MAPALDWFIPLRQLHVDPAALILRHAIMISLLTIMMAHAHILTADVLTFSPAIMTRVP